MWKLTMVLFAVLFLIHSSKAQQTYLSDIVKPGEYRSDQGLMMNIDYWYYDTCLYERPRICRENTSTGARIQVFDKGSKVIYRFITSNNSGYQSKTPDDSLTYTFIPYDIDRSTLRRKILINEKYYRTDTFHLSVIDTLFISDYRILKKAFGKDILAGKRSLRIFVFKSMDSSNSLMLHFWVEQIGIVKLTDEKYWRCSFQMNDDKSETNEKLFAAVMKIIKTKYKDPRWLPDKFYPD